MGLPRSQEMIRPDVFGYQSYKDFLRDYFHFLKLERPGFSIRQLARESGISVGYISNVLNGGREISKAALEKVIPHLELDENEISCLKLLATITPASTQEERMWALRRLQKFKKYSTLKPDEALVFNYFSKWYYIAIREMADLPGFKLDPKWVQEKLNFTVPLAEVAKALEFLIQNKLIEFKSNGTFGSTDNRVQCEGDSFRFILTHFHKQIFDLAAQAIDNTKRDRRNVRGHTLSLTFDDYKEAKQIMDEALDRIARLGANKAVDTTYHFLFLGFPLSKPPESGDE